jgi:hypothetical protein
MQAAIRINVEIEVILMTNPSYHLLRNPGYMQAAIRGLHRQNLRRRTL